METSSQLLRSAKGSDDSGKKLFSSLTDTENSIIDFNYAVLSDVYRTFELNVPQLSSMSNSVYVMQNYLIQEWFPEHHILSPIFSTSHLLK